MRSPSRSGTQPLSRRVQPLLVQRSGQVWKAAWIRGVGRWDIALNSLLFLCSRRLWDNSAASHRSNGAGQHYFCILPLYDKGGPRMTGLAAVALGGRA